MQLSGAVPCRLRKLDVSNNEIAVLPPESALAGLAELQILYLHANQLSSLQGTSALSSLTELQRLTLFDNPLA